MIASGAQRVALVATRFLDHDRRLPGDEVDQLVAVRVSLTAMGRGVLEVGRSQQVAVDWGGSPDGRGAKRTPPSLATSTTTASEGTTETSPGCTGTCAPSSALLTSGTLDTTAIRVLDECHGSGTQVTKITASLVATWRSDTGSGQRWVYQVSAFRSPARPGLGANSPMRHALPAPSAQLSGPLTPIRPVSQPTGRLGVRGSDASCRPRGRQTVGGIIAVVRQSASTWRAGSADRRRSPRNRR